jgi:predicted transcriptional regulator
VAYSKNQGGERMNKQEETISKIEKTMRAWIEDNLERYKNEPPAFEATSTQGERVKKANPAPQEIRAAFKDYCYVVKTMRNLAGSDEVEVDNINDIKKRFKVAK